MSYALRRLQRGHSVIREFWKRVHRKERPFEATVPRPSDWDSNARCPKCPLRLTRPTSHFMENFDRRTIPSDGFTRTKPV